MLAPIRSDPASLKRLAVADGLRGTAILMVMAFHLWGVIPGLIGRHATARLDGYLAHVFGSGWAGVDLFFVISGFLLTGNLYDARGSSAYFRSFYARRFLRVVPLYYAFLVVLFCIVPLSPALAGPLQIDLLRKAAWYYWTYTVNVAASFRATHDKIPLAHSHIWALCVEVQFYLIWPAIVLYGGSRRRLMRLCLIVMGVALVSRWLLTLNLASGLFRENAPYSLLPCRIDTFAFGGYLALAVRGEAKEVAWLRRLGPMLVAGAFLGLAGIYLGWHTLWPFDHPMNTIGFSFLTAGFGGLLTIVLGAESGTVLHRLFGSRPLVAAGKFSYGLYVVHLAVGFALISRVLGAWWTKPVDGSFFFANLGFLALVGTVSLALAWLSWHLIEKRAIALKRYVPYGTAKSRDTVGR
jgi:peptidoglycan/LPS O-acetylase OafA/YrhL